MAPFGRSRVLRRACLSSKAVKRASENDVLGDGKFSSDSPPISWYPGHIAKAERELSEYLKKVDVVIEVRDARIPLSTTHPLVPEWVGQRPLIVAIARLDQISPAALKDWREYYAINPAHPQRPDAKVYFVDGKLGAGVLTLRKQALKASEAINERRANRGIAPRAVRAAVIGFPNVGKSALINRLLGRKMAKSRNLPGVTRSLQWVRIGGSEGSEAGAIELLDSPGIIPARQLDQTQALKLAICNDIGEASYDRVVAAASLCDELNELHAQRPSYVNLNMIRSRYELPDFHVMSGEEVVYAVAEKYYKGNSVSAADKLLGDFRKGFMGFGSLEAPRDSSAGAKVRGVGGVAGEKRSGSGGGGGGEVLQPRERGGRESGGVGGQMTQTQASSAVEGNSQALPPAQPDRDALDPFVIGKGNYDGW